MLLRDGPGATDNCEPHFPSGVVNADTRPEIAYQFALRSMINVDGPFS